MGSPSIRDNDDFDDRSMVFVDKVSLPGPLAHKKSHELINGAHGKRRSLSVSEVELKKTMVSTSNATPLSQTPDSSRQEVTPRWEETTLTGILDDFKGELSQLEAVSGSSLDLRDPSTPARRTAMRTKTDGFVLSHDTFQDERFDTKDTTSSQPPTPTLTLHLSQSRESEVPARPPSPIVPPRKSSLQLQTPLRSSTAPSSIGSPVGPRMPNTRPAANPLPSRSGPSATLSPHSPRDTARLHVLHRSTASNSEPSLIFNNGDDARVRKHCFVQLTPLFLTRFFHCSLSAAKRLAARPYRQRSNSQSVPFCKSELHRGRRKCGHGGTREGTGQKMLARGCRVPS